MSEQQDQVTTTPQKDEISKVPSSDAEVAAEKVVAPVAEATVSQEVEEAAPLSEAKPISDEAEEKVNPTSTDDKELVSDEKNSENVSEPAKETNGDKVDDSNGHANEVENGKTVESSDKVEEFKPEEQAVDEVNGCCKRKTENGAEANEEEKTPKKAKTLDQDGDKATVEETAA